MTTRQIMGISTRRVAALPAGSKAAVFAPAAKFDHVQSSPTSQWEGVNYDLWTPGQAVNGFNMWGRFPFQVGDRLEMDGIDSAPTCYSVIEQIIMVDGATLDEDQLRLLGFADRAEWQEDGLPSRRGWLLSVRMTGEQKPHSTPSDVDIEVHNEDGTERFTKPLREDD